MKCQFENKIDPKRFVFDEAMHFNYGYTCRECPYYNTRDVRDGKVWCDAWRRYIDDPDFEADGCSKRPYDMGR